MINDEKDELKEQRRPRKRREEKGGRLGFQTPIDDGNTLIAK